MNDLTDEWKKGELPEGWYWCKCYNEEIKLLYYDGDSFELDDPETKSYYFFLSKDTEKLTILAPASYDELQNMNEVVNQAMSANIKLVEQNTQLKELLKDARNVLKMVDTYYGDYDSTKGFLIVERIDEVLK